MIEASKAHETRWTGTLTGAALKALVMEAIARDVGAPGYGNDIHLRCDRGHSIVWSDVTFELVHDHDWFLKEPRPTVPTVAAVAPADDA